MAIRDPRPSFAKLICSCPSSGGALSCRKQKSKNCGDRHLQNSDFIVVTESATSNPVMVKTTDSDFGGPIWYADALFDVKLEVLERVILIRQRPRGR